MAGSNKIDPNVIRKSELAMAGEERLAPVAAELNDSFRKQQDLDIKYVVAYQDAAAQGRVPQLDQQYKPSEKAKNIAKTWDTMSQSQRDQYLSGNASVSKAKTSLKKNGWATVDPKFQRTAIMNSKLAAGGVKLNWTDSFLDHPDVALAAASALNNGNIDSKQLDVLIKASDLIKVTSDIANAASDATRKKLYNRLSDPQKSAVIAISDAFYQDWIQKTNEAAAAAADEATSTVGGLRKAAGDAVSNVWGITGAKIFDAAIWLNNESQHLARAAWLTSDQNSEKIMSGQIGDYQTIWGAWDDTATGAVDEEAYKNLQNEFGASKVNLVRDAVQAMNDPEGFGNLIEKYANDKTALGWIDEIILDSERTQEMTDLLSKADMASRDDLGNMVAQTFLPDSWETQGNFAFEVLDKGTNIAATIFLDPTLILGKAVKGYRVFKYGLLRNMQAGNLAEVIAKPATQRVFNGLVEDIKKLNTLKNPTDIAALRSDVRIKYGKYVTDDAIDSLARYTGTYGKDFKNSTDIVHSWITESEGLEKLIAGKVVRTNEVLVPRMTVGRQKYIEGFLAAKKGINFDGSDDKFIRTVFGFEQSSLGQIVAADPYWDSYINEKFAGNVIDALNDPVTRRLIAEQYGVQAASTKLGTSGQMKGLSKSGKYRTRGWPTTRDEWAARVDRWQRNLEQAPSGARISIADDSSTNEIRAWARTTFSKVMADNLAEVWKLANEGQRRIMLAGMFRTIAEARGIYGTTDEQMKIIDEIVTSSLNTGEQYAVTQVKLAETLDDIDLLAEASARAGRFFMEDLNKAEQAKLAALGLKMAQVITRRKENATALKALAFDAGATGGAVKRDVEALSAVKSLKDEVKAQRTALEQGLKESESELRGLLIDYETLATGSSVLNLSKTSQSVFKAINKKIASLEKRLLKVSDSDKVKLQEQIDQLKLQREAAKKSRTADYFELKKLDELRGLIRNADGGFAAYNPAEINGRQHALHVNQLSTSISVPNFADIQKYSAKVGILNKILGFSWGEGTSTAVNTWSTLNLIGPRYVQRAAIEDHLGYIASGGSFRELAAGKRLTEALREARGRTTGLVGEKSKALGDIVQSDSHAVLGLFIKEHLNPDEIRIARELAATGDGAGIEVLVRKSLARMKLSSLSVGKKLSKDAEEAISAFVSTGDESLSLLDDMAEIGRDMNRPILGEKLEVGAYSGRMRKDMQDTRRMRTGDYQNISFNDMDTNAFILWARHLQGILHSDGAIGQIAFNSLRSSKTIAEARAKAIPKIMAAIEDGKVAVNRFTIFSEPGMTDAKFAARYFDDTANYFSASKGMTVNTRLIEKLTRRNPDTGAYYGAVYTKAEDGTRTSHLYLDDLRSFGNMERPEYVLGQREVSYTADELKVGAMDKAWSLMSESLGRLSREPIFLARYVDEYTTLKPLINTYVEQGLEPLVAQKMVRDLAVKRAQEISLAYMDNPKVRSIMAFNLRNLARYYRATEDFYRRSLRIVKYYPEALQKANLGYGMIEHSGFVHVDENGEQYFMYPGTGVLHNAIAGMLNLSAGSGPMITNPFNLGGKTLMLTPSADPDSWLPTFSSPLAAVPLKILTAFAPFSELEGLLLGSKSESPTTSPVRFGTELLNSILPSHVIRAMALLPVDDRESQYGSAVKGAMQVLAYNGYLDKENIQTPGQAEDLRTRISNISIGILGVRFLLGFVLPASPQLIQNDDTSDEARRMGIKSLRRGYTELLSKFEGDADLATAAWFRINPKLMPFTVSSTESVKQAYPSLTDEAGTWMKQNSGFIRKYPEAATFLVPRAGEFSFPAYSLAKSLGFIRGKELTDMFVDLVTARDYFVYQNTKDSFEADLATSVSAYDRNDKRAYWASLQEQMYSSNPWLMTRVNKMSDKSNKGLKEMVFKDVSAAINEIYTNNKELATESTYKIGSMIKTFNSAIIDIDRYSGKDSYSTYQRDSIRQQVRSTILEIIGDDVNAQNFYDLILNNMIGGTDNAEA